MFKGRGLKFTGFTACFIAGLMMAGSSALAVVEKGVTFPGVTIQNYNKKQVLDKKSLTGKVTVVNFWATWCEACKVELVEMEDMFRPYFAEDNFQMAFVSLDKNPEKAAQWFKDNLKDPNGLLKHLYIDPKFQAADKLEVDSFPMTFVIDQNGKVVHIQKGFKEGEGSTEEIAKIAKGLLN